MPVNPSAVAHTLRIILVAALAIVTILGGGCAQKENGAVDNPKPLVVCTTTIISDLARHIGGDRVEVVGIMTVSYTHLTLPTN